LDLSFAHSNFKGDFLGKLIPGPLCSSFENVKLNMGSIPMESKDIEFMLSLLPNTIKKLELHLDSIKIQQGFGITFAYQLNRFTFL